MKSIILNPTDGAKIKFLRLLLERRSHKQWAFESMPEVEADLIRNRMRVIQKELDNFPLPWNIKHQLEKLSKII